MMVDNMLDLLLEADLRVRLALSGTEGREVRAGGGAIPALAYLSGQSSTQLIRNCHSLLLALREQNAMPAPLLDLVKNDIVEQLIMYPELKGFEKYYIMLVCLMIKRHIRVYFLDSSQNLLLSYVYNFGFEEGVELAIGARGVYYPVLSEQEGACHLKVHELVTRVSRPHAPPSPPKETLSDYDRYKQKHKKSMSDNSMLDAFGCERGLFLRMQHNEGACAGDTGEDEDAHHVHDFIRLIEESTPETLPLVEQHSPYHLMMPALSLSPEEEGRRYTGRLKFFDEGKNYGFIIMDDDSSDIFVHFDDIQKAGISREVLRGAKTGQVIRLQFSCMNYIGKYKESRKAVDLVLLDSITY